MVFPESGVAPASTEPPRAVTPLPILGAIGLSFRILARAPWTFLGLVVLEFLVVAIIEIFAAFAKDYAWYPVLKIVVEVLGYLFQSILSGAVVFGVFEVASRGGFDFEAALGVGFRRALPVFAVLLLQVIIVTLGVILLVVPGIIAILMLSVAMPACVIETLGPIQSVRRSSALTKGHRWRLLGLFFSMLVIMILVVVAAVTLVWAHLTIVAVALGVVAFVAFLIVSLILPGVLFLQLRAIADGAGPLRLPASID